MSAGTLRFAEESRRERTGSITFRPSAAMGHSPAQGPDMARSYVADTIMIEFDLLDEEQVDIVRTGLTQGGRIPLMRRRRDSVLVRCEVAVEAEPDESYADVQGW